MLHQQRSSIPTYAVVTTRIWPLGVVALTLKEFNRTVMTGAVVSASTVVALADAQTDEAARHTEYTEHLRRSSSTF